MTSGLRPQASGLRPDRAAGFGPQASGCALCVVLLIACRGDKPAGGGAGSATNGSAAAKSGLVPPVGWQAVPQLAATVKEEATGTSVLGSEAWGDLARGCYAAWIALRGRGDSVDKMADQLLQSVATEPALAGIAVRDVVKPTAGAEQGVLSLSFERALYHGKLRATLVRDGRIAALACFWNQREPTACGQTCTQLIGTMR